MDCDRNEDGEASQVLEEWNENDDDGAFNAAAHESHRSALERADDDHADSDDDDDPAAPPSHVAMAAHLRLYSDDDKRALAVAELTDPVGLASGGVPRHAGLYDPRLGVTEPNAVCPTCSKHHTGVDDGRTTCNGHFGIIELPFRCYHIMYLQPIVLKLLQCHCETCARPLFAIPGAAEPQFRANGARVAGLGSSTRPPKAPDADVVTERLKAAVKACKDVPLCPHCHAPHAQFFKERRIFIERRWDVKHLRRVLRAMAASDADADGRDERSQYDDEEQAETAASRKRRRKPSRAAMPPASASQEQLWASVWHGRSQRAAAAAAAPFTAEDAHAVLNSIPDASLFALGFSPSVSHPRNMVPSTVLVVPPKMRPRRAGSGVGGGDHDLTVGYARILEAAAVARTILASSASPPATVRTGAEILQLAVAAMVDARLLHAEALHAVAHSPLAPPSLRGGGGGGGGGGGSGRPGNSRARASEPDWRDLLGSKWGLIRKNLMGRRSFQSARLPISPSPPAYDVWQVGVPAFILDKLTTSEIVCSLNLRRLQRAVQRGYGVRGGAAIVLAPATSDRAAAKFFLGDGSTPDAKRRVAAQLEPGWIVRRHLRSGDTVIINRQPTLHKASIFAAKAYRTQGRNLRIPLAVCPGLNADFDGDEMTVHVPGIDARDAPTIRAEMDMMLPHAIVLDENDSAQLAVVQQALVGLWCMTARDALVPRDVAAQVSMLVRYGPTCRARDDNTQRGELDTDGGSRSDSDDDCEDTQCLGQTKGKDCTSPPSLPHPAVFTRGYACARWSGAQLLSLALPRRMHWGWQPDASSEQGRRQSRIDDDAVSYMRTVDDALHAKGGMSVRRGIVIGGRATKEAVGTGPSAIAAVARSMGGWAAAKLVSDLQRLGCGWLDDVATVGIALRDLQLIETAGDGRDASAPLKRLRAAEAAALAQAEQGDVAGAAMTLNAARANLASALSLRPSALSAVLASGAKGNALNAVQMAGSVGTQDAGGGRGIDVIAPHLGGLGCGPTPLPLARRTLHSGIPSDPRPAARGYSATSYTQGMRPSGFFFAQRAGRYALAEPATAVSKSGYVNRKLFKAQEGVVVNYSGSVQTSGGGGTDARGDSRCSLVAFTYGGDGADAEAVQRLHVGPLFSSNNSNNSDQEAAPGYAASVEMLRALAPSGWAVLPFDAAELARETSANLLHRDSASAQDRIDAAAVAIAHTTFWLAAIEAHRDAAALSRTKRAAVDPVDLPWWRQRAVHVEADPSSLARAYWGAIVTPGSLASWGVHSRRTLDAFVAAACDRYGRSLVAPCKGVGGVAATSLGAPTTQLVLNMFHVAGQAGSDPTRGVRASGGASCASHDATSGNNGMRWSVQRVGGLQRLVQLVDLTNSAPNANMSVEIDAVDGTDAAAASLQLARPTISELLSSACSVERLDISAAESRLLCAVGALLQSCASAPWTATSASKRKRTRNAANSGVDHQDDEDDDDGDEEDQNPASSVGDRAAKAVPAASFHTPLLQSVAKAWYKRLQQATRSRSRERDDCYGTSQSLALSPWVLLLTFCRASVGALSFTVIVATLRSALQGAALVSYHISRNAVTDASGNDGQEILVVRVRCVASRNPHDDEAVALLVRAQLLESLRVCPPGSSPIAGVSKATASNASAAGWFLETQGSSLLAGACSPGVVALRTRSNNVMEVGSVLGLAAARATFCREMTAVLGMPTAAVSHRHVALLAAVMSFPGRMLGFRQANFSALSTSVFQRLTFEKPLVVAHSAAAVAAVDPLAGMSERMLVGAVVNVGTGSRDFRLLAATQRVRRDIEQAALDNSAAVSEQCTPSADETAQQLRPLQDEQAMELPHDATAVLRPLADDEEQGDGEYTDGTASRLLQSTARLEAIAAGRAALAAELGMALRDAIHEAATAPTPPGWQLFAEIRLAVPWDIHDAWDAEPTVITTSEIGRDAHGVYETLESTATVGAPIHTAIRALASRRIGGAGGCDVVIVARSSPLGLHELPRVLQPHAVRLECAAIDPYSKAGSSSADASGGSGASPWWANGLPSTACARVVRVAQGKTAITAARDPAAEAALEVRAPLAGTKSRALAAWIAGAVPAEVAEEWADLAAHIEL